MKVELDHSSSKCSHRSWDGKVFFALFVSLSLTHTLKYPHSCKDKVMHAVTKRSKLWHLQYQGMHNKRLQNVMKWIAINGEIPPSFQFSQDFSLLSTHYSQLILRNLSLKSKRLELERIHLLLQSSSVSLVRRSARLVYPAAILSSWAFKRIRVMGSQKSAERKHCWEDAGKVKVCYRISTRLFNYHH